jgi:hypothetical protein
MRGLGRSLDSRQTTHSCLLQRRVPNGIWVAMSWRTPRNAGRVLSSYGSNKAAERRELDSRN